MSAGWRMAYVPQVIVHHDPSRARDAAARRRLALRNALWLAWLRRPWPRAIAATRTWLAESVRDRELLRNALDALCGVPWIVRGRRVVPPHVEQALCTIETFYGEQSGADGGRVEASPAKAA